MRYIAVIIAFALWTSGVFYGGYNYCSDQEEIKRLKVELAIANKKIENEKAARKAIEAEEEKEKEVVIINRDFADAAQKAIIASTENDNPECASFEFMRALKNLR